MGVTQVQVDRYIGTYCFQYDGHAEEWIGELHGHEQGYDEVTFTTAHSIVLQW